MAALNPALSAPREGSRGRLVTYWITTILGPASFVMGGTMMLTRHPEVVKNLAEAGMPVAFATILGFWKLAGAIVCVVPRLPLLKEWAYAGFGVLLLSAAGLHALNGDGVAETVAPLFYVALVAASYLLRPASRRLTSKVNP